MRTSKSDGILYIDGFNWSALKHSETDLDELSEADQRSNRKPEEETFARYHDRLRSWIEGHGGTVWNTIGDCTIASGFPTIDEAVAAAQTIQRRLERFNDFENQLGSPLMVRIGVARGSLPNVPPAKRGAVSPPALDEAGHLEKDCPPGGIRISRGAFVALRFSQHEFRPGLSADLKSKSEGSFVWIDRMLTAQDREAIAVLPPRQKRAYPPIVVSQKYLRRYPCTHDFSQLPEILKDVFVILGETRLPNAPNGPVSHSASTSDAVGLLEILAALESSPKVAAGMDEWADTIDRAAQSSIIVVGSPAVNLFAYAANRVLPVGFAQEPSGPMRIRVQDEVRARYFPESFEHSGFDRHIGFALLTRSPFNPKHSLLWIAGISGMATQAAARFVRDLIINPSRTLSGLKADHPNVAVVAPAWEAGYEPEQYQGMWRVTDYHVKWIGRQ